MINLFGRAFSKKPAKFFVGKNFCLFGIIILKKSCATSVTENQSVKRILDMKNMRRRDWDFSNGG